MEAVAGLFLFFALFQVAGASLLGRQTLGGRRGPPLVLAGLLVLNTILTVLSFLDSLEADVSRGRFAHALLDAPTGALLLAYVALRHDRRLAAKAAFAFAGAIVLVGAFNIAALENGPLRAAVVSIPYYLGLSLVVATSARGQAIDRWIAVAFAPRALLFATQSVDGLLTSAAAQPAHGLVVMGAAVLMGITCALALVGILRDALPGGPPVPIVLVLSVAGPADAFAWSLVDASTSRGMFAATALNYITLAFLRPLFLYHAFAPHETMRLLSRSLLGAGIGLTLVVAAPALGLPALPAGIVALSLASLALAYSEVRRAPRQVPVDAPSAPHVPQWRTLLLALADAGAAGGGPPIEPWTQGGLARATGISVQRVSEFPDTLHASAEQKLDRHLPDWRATTRGAPTLVTVHTGHVHGLPGPRVYYRLTALGARLAATLREPATPAPRPPSKL